MDINHTGKQQDHTDYSSTSFSQQDDFISLVDILKMLLKHFKKIVIFTILATVLAGIIFLNMPRKFGAESVLQVVLPERTDRTPDRDQHEANILSHQEYLQSSVMAARVANELHDKGIELTSLSLRRNIEIIRPPNTNLLRINIASTSQNDALTIANVWRDEYMDILSEISVQNAIVTIQQRLAVLQNQWIEKKSQAEELQRYADLIEDEKIITLSRSIEEGALWKILADGVDEEKLKKLSDINFQDQHLNEEYLMLKNILVRASGDAHSASYVLSFYRQALKILCGEAIPVLDRLDNAESLNSIETLAVEYVQMLMDIRDIFPIGDPAPVEIARGAAKKTIIVFFFALFIACTAAFVVEFLKNQKVV